jgi:hypothetical protein
MKEYKSIEVNNPEMLNHQDSKLYTQIRMPNSKKPSKNRSRIWQSFQLTEEYRLIEVMYIRKRLIR